MSYRCTVVIRTRNVYEHLCVLFGRLQVQRGVSLSVVVVDNDSTDGTAELALAHEAKLVRIGEAEFSWGRALNRGIAVASDEVVLLLSADAYPCDEMWAARMTEAVMMPGLAAVFGRQIPRRSAPIDEWVRVRARFPDCSALWTSEHLRDGQVPGLIASNACAALRRQVWQTVPFDESLLGAEEPPWVAAVLSRGYAVGYTHRAVVEHSHRDPAFRQARRLWELSVQSLRHRGREPTLLDVGRFCGAFMRSRLRNLCTSGVGWSRRAEGVLRFPWEEAVLLWVSLCSVRSKSSDRLHRRW